MTPETRTVTRRTGPPSLTFKEVPQESEESTVEGRPVEGRPLEEEDPYQTREKISSETLPSEEKSHL